MKWLQPYMEDKLKELGKSVIICPISFTVDNSETLGVSFRVWRVSKRAWDKRL